MPNDGPEVDWTERLHIAAHDYALAQVGWLLAWEAGNDATTEKLFQAMREAGLKLQFAAFKYSDEWLQGQVDLGGGNR